MARVVWSEVANEDLKNIANYIERGSAYYAKFTVQAIHQKIKVLKEFPYHGRIIPKFDNESYRELIYGNYRIMYFASTEEVKIVTIVHCKRDV